jgi:hypothetical protein
MTGKTPPSQRYEQGDRVHVDKAIVTIPAMPAYIGLVKEVIFCYTDNTIGYNLSLEDDPRPGRVWFFLQHQLRRARGGKGVAAPH